MYAKCMLVKVTRHLRSRMGFTFVETLVTCVIFAFLAAAINTMILIGNSSWQVNATEVDLQQHLRQAMESMRSDIQQTGAVSFDASVPITNDWATFTSFIFRKVIGVESNGSIKWNRDDSFNPITTQYVQVTDPDDYPGYSLNDVLKIEGGVTRAVAQNIQSIQIRRLTASSDIVEVLLTAQKNTLSGAQGRPISSTLTFQAQLRN